jgi:hypothetical protein
MTAIDRASTQRIVSSPAVTANGNLFANVSYDGVVGMINTDGMNGLINLVLIATGTGTCSITPQSWFLDTAKTYFNLGYQPTNGQSTLTRTTGAYALSAAGTVVLQILDPAPAMQFVVSSVSGTVSLNAILYLSPL